MYWSEISQAYGHWVATSPAKLQHNLHCVRSLHDLSIAINVAVLVTLSRSSASMLQVTVTWTQ